jgi:ribosome recycling factor
VKLADLSDIEEAMSKAVEATQRAFNTIRTGRANSSLLDKVMVEYYGTPTPLKSLANISIPDASTLTIQPFDPGSLTTLSGLFPSPTLASPPTTTASWCG